MAKSSALDQRLLHSCREIQPKVEDWCRVRQCADRNQVYSSRGNLTDSAEIDAAGRLGETSSGNHFDGLSERRGLHVVEKKAVDFLFQRRA
jgi:hypothetical protein